MRASISLAAAAAASLIGLHLLSASASAQGYYCSYMQPPRAPDMSGPGFYARGYFGLVFGPNYCVRPPFPPFQGMVTAPSCPPGAYPPWLNPPLLAGGVVHPGTAGGAGGGGAGAGAGAAGAGCPPGYPCPPTGGAGQPGMAGAGPYGSAGGAGMYPAFPWGPGSAGAYGGQNLQALMAYASMLSSQQLARAQALALWARTAGVCPPGMAPEELALAILCHQQGMGAGPGGMGPGGMGPGLPWCPPGMEPYVARLAALCPPAPPPALGIPAVPLPVIPARAVPTIAGFPVLPVQMANLINPQQQQQQQQGGGPGRDSRDPVAAFPTHLFARSPRDFFMVETDPRSSPYNYGLVNTTTPMTPTAPTAGLPDLSATPLPPPPGE